MKQVYAGYEIGYLVLPGLKLVDLPEKITVKGDTLVRKREHHISLVWLNKLAPMIDKNNIENIKQQMIEEFNNFTNRFPLTQFKLKDDMRLLEKDDKKTIIIMAAMPRIDDFFERLRQKYDKDLPTQPTHITLYTRPPDVVGQGLLSDEELQKYTKPIELPELQILL